MKYFRIFFFILSTQIIFDVEAKYINAMNEIKSPLTTLTCIHPKRDPRIVGGSDTIQNEIPFMVSLTRRGGHFCGGSIINEKWILTAGHCLCNGFNNILKANQIKAVLGLHRISKFQKNTEHNSPNSPFEVSIVRIILHLNYKCSKPNNDIALLELTKPIKFTEQIQPTCIITSLNDTINYDNLHATVSGWGWTDENQEIGERSDKLQKAKVKIWNNDKCQKSFQDLGKKNIIGKSQMCAGYEIGGIDSCWADSGGPLIMDKVLIGIVSTGIGCARPGLPGIYTRISYYVEWIESVINLN